MNLSAEEEVDLCLAISLAKNSAKRNKIADSQDYSYWVERERIYEELLNKLHTLFFTE